jgi:Uma2 family endonuclease
MASATTLVPVDVYLNTSYRPDCDYIDGELLERNVGELPHGRMQGFFVWLFRNHEADWRVEAVPEQRVQISPTRFRVPDVCIVSLSATDRLIVRTPPLVCIEILSREDRMVEMQERVEDYLGMGVGAVWVVDPWRRRAFSAEESGALRPIHDALTAPGTQIRVPVADVFAELERHGNAAVQG